MKLIFSIFLFVFLRVHQSTAENNDTRPPLEPKALEVIPQQSSSNYNEFAERIFHFYDATLSVLRDSYAEEPLNGITNGSIDAYGVAISKNYTVSLSNITISSADFEDQSFRLRYQCTSVNELKMIVVRHQTEQLNITSAVEIPTSVDSKAALKGSLSANKWKMETTNAYELFTNNSHAVYISTPGNVTLNVDSPNKFVFIAAVHNSNYIPKLESFVIQTLKNDGNEKANGEIYSKFSKTTCNELVLDKIFQTIIINDLPRQNNIFNTTISSVVIQSQHSFADIIFDASFDDSGYFTVTFGKMKIQCEYALAQALNETKNFEYFADNLKITLKMKQKNLQVAEIKGVTLNVQLTNIDEVLANQLRQYVQQIIQETLEKAIFDRFYSASLSSKTS